MRLFLPVAGDQELDEHGNQRSVASPTTRGETLLVVEDNPGLRVTTVAALAGLGFRPIAVGDAQEAMAVLATAPDMAMLLTDIVLPGGKDGVELAKEVRALRPDLPVVFMSGYSDVDLLAADIPGPTIAFIRKPFRVSHLAAVVAEALAGAGRSRRPADS